MKPENFDVEGLVRAFSDAQRQKNEYILDTEEGTVHFIPLKFLRAVDEGTLDVEGLSPQDQEKARVAEEYADDIIGRYELIPFVDEEMIAEWKSEFLTEKGDADITPENRLAWEAFRVEQITAEIEYWLEESGILDEGTDEDDW